MKVRDITDAIADSDRETMRRGFRALVDLSEDMVEAASPGLLVVALNRLCAAFAEDDATMPALHTLMAPPRQSVMAPGWRAI